MWRSAITIIFFSIAKKFGNRDRSELLDIHTQALPAKALGWESLGMMLHRHIVPHTHGNSLVYLL